MARKHVVQPYRSILPTSVSKVLQGLAGKAHHHACVDCKAFYTDNCDIVSANGRCSACRAVRPQPRPLWETNADPAECCYAPGACQQVKQAHLLGKYRLCGPGPWFQCTSCHRSHSFIPRRNP